MTELLAIVQNLLLAFGFFILWCVFLHRGAPLSRKGLLFIFTFYLIEVFVIAGIPFRGYASFSGIVNLIPFSDIIFKGDLLSLFLDGLNVLFFIPLGFLLPYLWEAYRRLWKTVLFGLGMSLFIEVSQLFTFRCCDIDDLLMNTLGSLLGYLLFIVVMVARKKPLPEGYRSKAEPIVAVFFIFAYLFFCYFPFSTFFWNLFL